MAGFFVKVYLVTEVLPTGEEYIIAAKLTHEAAQKIVNEGQNRRLTRLIADK